MAREAVRRDWDSMFATADGEAKWHDGTFRNWATERSSQFPFHRDDGVTVFAAEYDDGSWDALLGRSEREQSDGDSAEASG